MSKFILMRFYDLLLAFVVSAPVYPAKGFQAQYFMALPRFMHPALGFAVIVAELSWIEPPSSAVTCCRPDAGRS
ncbi:MAG: hypothetical protein OXI87_10350 [Albidovulum sp.]|nr:hypothetical protein [Albidovulum sp.]